MKPCLLSFVLILCSLFSACGGSGSSGTITPPPATYSIGGTVSGLSGAGLVLQDNGGNNLPVAANGSFAFTTQLTAGSAYAVSVFTQPSSPAQTCTVTSGTGTANANVTTVQVACTNNVVTYTIGGSVSGLSGTGLMLQNSGGDNLTVVSNGAFTFATPVASSAAYAVSVLTQPSNPAQTCTTTNGSGTANANITNIQVSCSNNNIAEWTWIDGPNVVNQSGIYGTKGTASPSNIPPPRNTATSWTDTSGNLWLFGGATGSTNAFNDLWKFSTGEWTWVSGANTPDQQGVYGTLGTAAPGNVPGARAGAASWTDASGNLWLFGGYDGKRDWFNDLWKYSGGEWTWMSGPNLVDQQGMYGTKGTAAPANIPGARWQAVSWIDAAGVLWLLGGKGYDSAGNFEYLNDLWKYSAGQWTWISGSNLADQPGTYGTKGTGASANVPGARASAVSWTDNFGNLWLFGGRGFDSQQFAVLNDLWVFSANQWTWIAGDNIGSQHGIYGTLGVSAPKNNPGSRDQAVGWRDAAGNLWLFGGSGLDSATDGDLNDLWMYSSGEWTWMGGSNIVNQPGTYGTQGTSAPANIPGSRWGTVGWSDPAGNFWLFGGLGLDSTDSPGSLNDLWEYQP